MAQWSIDLILHAYQLWSHDINVSNVVPRITN